MANKPWRPMLAEDLPRDERGNIILDTLTELKHFPMFASFKLDGIRGTVREGGVLSRTGKLLPSWYAQNAFAKIEFEGLDGELIAWNAKPGQIYKDTHSAVMTHGCKTPLIFHVFDNPDDHDEYRFRRDRLESRVYRLDAPNIKMLAQVLCHNVDDVLQCEAQAFEAGHEGLIVRRPDALYKQGRSTLNQGYLLKVKRTMDSEGRFIGEFVPMMHNTNAAVLNDIGYTKRSSHKDNMVPTEYFGTALCEDIHNGMNFNIGSGIGMDMALRADMMKRPDYYRPKIFKYRYVPYGTDKKPRHCRIIGWRDPIDIDMEG